MSLSVSLVGYSAADFTNNPLVASSFKSAVAAVLGCAPGDVTIVSVTDASSRRHLLAKSCVINFTALTSVASPSAAVASPAFNSHLAYYYTSNGLAAPTVAPSPPSGKIDNSDLALGVGIGIGLPLVGLVMYLGFRCFSKNLNSKQAAAEGPRYPDAARMQQAGQQQQIPQFAH